MTTTPITRDTRNPNSAEVLHEQAASDRSGIARTAAHLLRLPTPEIRSIARQERTYRQNTESGWRPSDLMGNIVDGLLSAPDGATLRSPVALATLAETFLDAADVRALERDLA